MRTSIQLIHMREIRSAKLLKMSLIIYAINSIIAFFNLINARINSTPVLINWSNAHINLREESNSLFKAHILIQWEQ